MFQWSSISGSVFGAGGYAKLTYEKINENIDGKQINREEIAKALDKGFREIKDELSQIIKTLDWKKISGYNDVELAITDALSDFQFDSDIDLLSRVVNLSSALTWFLYGLLGRNRLSVDIMLIVSKTAKVIKHVYFFFISAKFIWAKCSFLVNYYVFFWYWFGS